MFGIKSKRFFPIISGIFISFCALIVFFHFKSTRKAATKYPSAFGIEALKAGGLDKAVVARVGDLEISGEEFFVSYETGPSFVKRKFRSNPQHAHLRFMIYEKLMALEGLAQGIDKKAPLQNILEEIRQDLAVTAMFQADIYDTLKVSRQEVEQAVAEATINLKLKYVFAKNESQMTELQGRLQSGIPFDSLAPQNGKPSLPDLPAMNLWEIKQYDAALAEKLASLRFRQLSEVITTPAGYYLARVDTSWREMFITPPQYNELLAKYEKRLKRNKVEALAYEYAAQRLEAAKPVIKGAAFDQLLAFMEKLDDQPNGDPEAVFLRHWPGSLDRAGIEEKQNAILAETAFGNFSLDDFLDWYTLRRFPLDRRSPPALASSLKNFVWRMVRDRMLAREAGQRGYDQNAPVQEEIGWWQEKLAYWEVRENLLEDLRFTEEQGRKFYEENKHRYGAPTPVPFDNIKSKVAQDMYSFEEGKRLMRYLNRREREISVKVNHEVLAQIPVTDLKLSRPIDVALFKKEGTFPRSAYPTIDRVWERH